jgi:hypothetical protein
MVIKDIMKLDRPMIILMLGVLLSHLGTYMVTPILPIVLRMEAGLSIYTDIAGSSTLSSMIDIKGAIIQRW